MKSKCKNHIFERKNNELKSSKYEDSKTKLNESLYRQHWSTYCRKIFQIKKM